MKTNNKIFLLVGSIFISILPGIIGSFFTINSIENWYADLNKPFFNPPNWIFSPVWTTLYLMIGISLYLILVNREKIKNTKLVFILFTLNLLLNASWSIVFFELKMISLALLNIISLCVVVFFCILEFYKINKNAAFLLLPYLFWIIFASFLNLAILILN
jgi:tryptophan-rich sensory protein